MPIEWRGRRGTFATLSTGYIAPISLDYNPRSRAAFAKAGFRVVDHIALPPGGKARSTCDMRIAPAEWAAGANPSS